MGAPMARNLARAGHEVRAWNRSPDKLAPVARRRRRRARGPRRRGGGRRRRADHAGRRRRGARRRAAWSLAEGQIWWQASTIGIEGIEQCEALTQETGAILVDAPVLGTRLPAEEGNLVVLASGLDAALDSLRAALRRGRAADHAPRGCGHRDAAQARGQPVGPGRDPGHRRDHRLRPVAGVEPEWVLEALEGGALDLPYFRMKSEAHARRGLPGLLRAGARGQGCAAGGGGGGAPRGRPAPSRAAIAERFTQATEAGHGDEDMAATYRLSKPG